MSPELLNPAMGDDQTKFNLNSSARFYISRHRAEVKPERNCIAKPEVKPTSNLSSSKMVKTKPLGIAIHASQVTIDCPLEDEDLHIIFVSSHFTQNPYYSVTQLIYWFRFVFSLLLSFKKVSQSQKFKTLLKVNLSFMLIQSWLLTNRGGRMKMLILAVKLHCILRCC